VKKLLQATKHRMPHAVACRRQPRGRSSNAQDEDQEERGQEVPRASGGTVKRGAAFKRHILTKKSTTRKRHLRGVKEVHETNLGSIAKMLPFAGL
jgi:large subunit ribosomal protein L35